MSNKTRYYVYILECSDKTFYTGYSINLQERIQTHNKGKGAKYTRGRRPVNLIWAKRCRTLSEALREELNIKKLTKDQKLLLIKKDVVKK